jgi:hypothetical protein
MRKLVLGTVLSTLALAGLGSAPASAGNRSFPTTFGDTQVSCGIENPGPEEICLYGGYIESPRAKCIPNRKVKMFALVGVAGTPELVDVGKTAPATPKSSAKHAASPAPELTRSAVSGNLQPDGCR